MSPDDRQLGPNGGHLRPSHSPLDRLIRLCLENKLVVALFVLFIVGWGMMVAPFDWDLGALPRDPVPVDAIPDIGENQQIVFTDGWGAPPRTWRTRSPIR